MTPLSRARRATAGARRRIAATAIAALFVLAGCTPASDRPETDGGAWVGFGPFEVRGGGAASRILNGTSELRLPGGDLATLDAEKLLGSGPDLPPLPDRENYTITDEQYSYTLDGDAPRLVGVVQARHTMHFRGYTEDEFVTFVLAISAEHEPRELTRTRVLRGGEHTATITGRSDQGVIAVQLEGALNTNVPHDSRVIGVDAIRATEVWGKEHGYSGFGDGTASFYLAPARDACATEVQRYSVANGRAEHTESFANTDVATGGTCVTAAAAAAGAAAGT